MPRSTPIAKPGRSDRPTPRDASSGPKAAGARDSRASRHGGEHSLLPSPTRLIDVRSPYLLPAVLLVVARCVAWAEIRIPAEDAFIMFRYARNFAAGNGLVFNPGERVMGFTSPLWTLWNAAGIALLHDAPLWSRLGSIVADLATLGIAVRLLERDVSRAAAWCFAVFFAIWPYFSASAVSGMESSAFLFLIALSSALAVRRDTAAGVALGALALVRPEGLVCAAVVACWASGRSRVVGLGVTAAGMGALAWYYGSPIPQSLTAKSDLYGLAGPWAARHWWEWASPVVFARWPIMGDTSMLTPLTILLAPALVVGALGLWRRRGTAAAAMGAACLVVWAGYALLGVAYFWWYLLVPLAGVGLVASAGFPSIVRGRAVPIAAVLLLASAWSVGRQLYVGRAQAEYASFARAAQYLRSVGQPGDTVLAEPIGMIGYAVPAVIVDEVGLVSPDVARRRRAGPGWYTDVVARTRPHWLVVRAGVLSRGQAFAGRGTPFRDLGERDSLLARYALATKVDTTAGDNALLVLRRVR